MPKSEVSLLAIICAAKFKKVISRRIENGSVEPYSLSCGSPTNPMVEMLDHPEKTARLLAELKAAVPFKAAKGVGFS